MRIRTGCRMTMLLLAGAGLAAEAQMVNPAMDRQPGPFSYFSRSTDEVGVMGAVSAAELTPEGFLYTGFGELIFLVGPEQMPTSARVRTLEDGSLPVYSWSVENAGIEYRFTVFSARVGEGYQGPIVNFARVTVTNPGHAPRMAFLTTAVRHDAVQTTEHASGDLRFQRPMPDGGAGQFYQPGEAFRRDWSYGFEAHAFVRGGKALYLFPAVPEPKLALTLHSHYNRVHPLKSEVLTIEPTTPAGAASYSLRLQPGESRTLDFKMPLLPVAPDAPEFAAIEKADFDRSHAETVAFWKQMLNRGMRIEVPEKKVTETFDASLIYCLLAIKESEGQTIQTVNAFQYHRFYLRDSADFVRMYDATGYSDIAARVLSFFPSRQQPDGNIVSQAGQYDGWGEALWSFGEHYRRTHDVQFARQVFPVMVRAVDWLEQARAKDPLHLIPVSDVRDNEYVAAHLTGYNFLALGGLLSAIDIAKAAGHDQDAKRFEAIYQDYRRCFLKKLDEAASEEKGYIPPSLDGGKWKGTDWGNLLSVTPVEILDPWDPRVTATLKQTQAKYQEGITTYSEPDDGQYLHHYLTIKNTLTELIRGEQNQVMREFYAELLHTSSTHAGFEYAIRPWGMRDFQGNLAPHGWFAADYRSLLRNMMVREQGENLHLLSALSPEWIGAGKKIVVTHAPTVYGQLSFTLQMDSEQSATLQLEKHFERQPGKIVLHLPWFMQTEAVLANGRKLQMVDGSVEIPRDAGVIRIQWKRTAEAAAMSYERTVESYKTEYSRRYEEFLSTGQGYPAVDSWKVPE